MLELLFITPALQVSFIPIFPRALLFPALRAGKEGKGEIEDEGKEEKAWGRGR